MAIPESLDALLRAPGPSGQEDAGRGGVARGRPDVRRGPRATCSARHGCACPAPADGPLLAIVGHIDEIALVVTHAGDDGLLAVRALGGFDPHVLLGQRVEILTRDGPLPAVVGAA